MNTTILIAYDGSAPAERAVLFANSHFDDARYVLVTVVDPYERLYGAYGSVDLDTVAGRDPTASGEELLAEARDQLDPDAEVELVVGVGRPAHAILAEADEHDVDHIVIGSHGRSGTERLLLGSVAETVLRRATVPVTVVR
ncbi:MAG: universal stress protein [Halobacteriota archaeon]